VAANNVSGNSEISFSVVRYGNVMGSRGSVVPFFLAARKEGYIPITDPEMTRFNITLQEGVEMVEWAISNAVGGEILVPKIPSYRIMDLAKAIAPDCDHKIVGVRPGEKIHEEMITTSDSANTFSIGKYFVIVPDPSQDKFKKFITTFNGVPVGSGFSYNSGSNEHFLSSTELRTIIKKHVDPEFV
jgi:FlaA1/EpsC-like NDP-sugar epimerase